MIHDKYTAKETLEKIKLHMKYDSSKTLNENTELLKEESWDYWKEITKSFMNRPEQKSLSSIKVGNPTVDVNKVCKNIKGVISGINFNKSQESKDLLYNIEKSFTTLDNAIAIFKKYPSIGGESLYSALNDEWFISDVLDGIIDGVSNQIKLWCSTNPKVSICKEKTKEELKFGL